MLSKYLIQFSVDGWSRVPTHETDPDLPVSVQEFPEEAWVGGGLLQGSAVHGWGLLKEVTSIFITSSIVWPQVNSRYAVQSEHVIYPFYL